MLLGPLVSTPGVYSSIKKKMDDSYLANQSLWQVYWTEAMIDNRLEAGDLSLMPELTGTQFNGGGNQYFFNRTRPICNMVSGYQRRNRKSSVVVPLENADQETADQWTKILLNIYKRQNVYETISEAFHEGACISGMNLLHVYLDFQDDPICGEIKVDNLAFNRFYIDPYFRKPDLSDCQFIWKRSYLTHLQAAMLMPEKADEIMNLPGNPRGVGRDGRFQFMPEAMSMSGNNRLAYDEYYYRDFRDQKKLFDRKTGEWLDVSYEDEDKVKLFLEENPDTFIETCRIPTVRLAIAIQDQVYYDGPQPLLIDNYCFVPVLGYYNPSLPYFYNRIQGIVRSLRDPQVLLNRRIILSADLLESQTNSGWIFKENAVLDINHLFQTGQGRVIPLKQEAQMTDIQPIIPPQIPPSFFQLQETFSQEMNMVSGINEELMGQALDDKAGILAALRQGAGLTTLQPIFDRLDFSQSILGRRIMEAIQANYTPEKVSKLLEGETPAPLFFRKAFGQYHCMVEAGFNTESQKQMEFAQALQLFELGILKDSEYVLEKSTMQGKNDLIKRQQQQSQMAQQQQQQQMQIQMQELQSRSQLSQARAQADIGLYNERTSRVEENRALAIQKIAEANKDDEMALLNKIKILKELEELDISHLERYVTIANMLKGEERSQKETPAR
jgi:hypothetical protein